MANTGNDPYRTLGVRAGVSDEELRKTYRRLVQRHHPDHNDGSAESARRFEEIQEAYARIKRLRGGPTRTQTGQTAQTAPPESDPGVEARLADLERELREAQAARERAARAQREARNQAVEAARQAAREAGSTADLRRASNEDLGYVTTDDSFTQILADARAELSEGLTRAREHPVARRVSDLIDELEDLASRGDRESPPRRKP